MCTSVGISMLQSCRPTILVMCILSNHPPRPPRTHYTQQESRCAVPPPSPSDTATTRQSSLSPLTMPPSSPSSSCPSPSPDEDGAQTPTVADEESFELRLHRANLAYKQLSKPFYGIVREKAERYIGVLQYRAAGGTLAEFEAYKAALVKHTKEHDDVISIMLAIEDALPMCVQEEEHLPGVEKAINALALEIEDLVSRILSQLLAGLSWRVSGSLPLVHVCVHLSGLGAHFSSRHHDPSTAQQKQLPPVPACMRR